MSSRPRAAEPRVPIKHSGGRTEQRVGCGPGPCGTYAGVSAHNRRGEPVCDDCLAARAAYTALRRLRSGHLHDLRRCSDCGSVFPRTTPATSAHTRVIRWATDE